jgi:hypothetical protein
LRALTTYSKVAATCCCGTARSHIPVTASSVLSSRPTWPVLPFMRSQYTCTASDWLFQRHTAPTYPQTEFRPIEKGTERDSESYANADGAFLGVAISLLSQLSLMTATQQTHKIKGLPCFILLFLLSLRSRSPTSHSSAYYNSLSPT